MKLTFSKKTINDAPKDYVRVRFTDDDRGVKRLVREGTFTMLELGIGKPEDMNHRRFITLCRSIVRAAKELRAKKIVIQFDRTPALFKNLSKQTTPEWVSRTAAEAFVMANHEFRRYKTKPKDGWRELEEILLCGESSPAIEGAAKRGEIVAGEVNAARELANTPGGDMTPEGLARAAKMAVKGLPVSVQTLTKTKLAKLGMGALLGVAKGSSEVPTFTVLEYKGASGAPIVLAGKGVTFDSGGLNLKSESGIYEMHMDMSGAAAVIHTVAAAARLKIKKHVIALIPAVENMPGNNAYRPGDILKSLSGKTIEVLNTDAEGRLILADAIAYAKRFKPAVVIDVATLTGAAMIALGLHASGLMTRDDELAKKLETLGEESGDYVWRLPLWDEYEDSVKGTFADLSNVPGNNSTSRYGGASNGAMFLWQFAKELDCPWAHLDIAPKMTANAAEELVKGAAGAPVRLLIRFIEQWT
jgi:leucyl aminopeptidase